ncbi:MAG: agmatine deiminase family protein [Actinomycetota bacterium]
MEMARRTFLYTAAGSAVAAALGACGALDAGDDAQDGAAIEEAPVTPPPPSELWMPAEEERHEATWMCFPGRRDVWGRDLAAVQRTIADIALAIADHEPVRLLARPDDVGPAADLMGSAVELIEAPVDDLWARDTLCLFLVGADGTLAASRVGFNGWGQKQVHDGDARLAAIVADIVGVDLYDLGLVGEGGGLETDGDGTLLAARSSWVNDNRNPGWSEAEITDAMTALLGAERVLWVDGVAGEDITDGHIDTLARFTDPGTLIHELPSYVEPGETWYDVAVDTEEALAAMTTLDGDPYELVTLRQPETLRRDDPDFLSSYVNYYVCNGAVLVPSFGDAAADGAAAERIGDRLPGREVIAIDIDPLAAGGGGIHCATQQQPAVG